MLRPDVVVVEAAALVLREREDTLGAVVEAIERSHRSRAYGLLVRQLRFQRCEKQPALQPQRLGHRAADLLAPIGGLLELLRPFVGIDAKRGIDRFGTRIDAA